MITRSVRQQSLLNAYWIPINFQNTAILTIAAPAALQHIVGARHTAVWATLASAVAAMAMIVPPVAGAISDHFRRRGGLRRPFVLAGAGVNVIGLLWLSRITTLDAFVAALLIAILGQSISLAAYQPLIPEVVERSAWGLASGYQGIGSLAGSVLGFAFAIFMSPTKLVSMIFLWSAAFVVAGALAVAATPERHYVDDGEHARIGNWYNFVVAFISRMVIYFGLTLLMTFVLYFFHDVQKAQNPSASTGFFGVLALGGAVVTSFWMGHLSDRVPRKVIVALAGVPMSLAIFLFAATAGMHWIAAIALLFGLGYGAFVSSGWALALDSVPQLRDVARDLGIWGLAGGLPGIAAPAFGGWLLAHAATPLAGYQALFSISAGCFIAGSIIVLLIGKPDRARFGICFQAFAFALTYPYYWTAYRLRRWGRLPWRRGATLVLCNHQHDLDTNVGITRLILDGPWNRPIYSAGSRRMFEPGFMTVRFPWLRSMLRKTTATKLFMALGCMPIENELRTRSLGSLAWWVYARHGDVPLGSVFRVDVVAKLDAAAATFTLGQLLGKTWFRRAQEMRVSLKAVLEPYRSEIFAQTRDNLEPDYQRLQQVLRDGNTMFLTPEGRYTKDGAMSPLRSALTRLAPLAETIYLDAMSYDVFVGKRLSGLFRIVLPPDPSDLESSMKAMRPVVVSQPLSSWIVQNDDVPIAQARAIEEVRSRLASLPVAAFVDPELQRNPERLTGAALAGLMRLGILEKKSGVFCLTAKRKHPQFPLVDDMLAFQARFFHETIGALMKLESANKFAPPR